jgi:dinuclear metal center YbgI/SA1388 family protein
MKVLDVKRAIEGFAPTYLAEEFDNVGLLVGDENREVTSVLITLDVDMGVAKEAVSKGANLIISHHPVIFDPVKRITADTPGGRLLMYLIENKISVYSAHTNLDSAAGGLNDVIANLLELSDTSPLGNEGETGLGRAGELPREMTVSELCEKLKNIFSLPCIRFSGEAGRKVSRVALCSGGGGSLVEEAVLSNADVYISGDIKYAGVRDAESKGLSIIEVGHYESEILSTGLFERIIKDALGEKVTVRKTQANKNVFNMI